MAVKSTKNQYGSAVVIFHWLTALLILSLIPLGIFMHEQTNVAIKAGLFKAHIAIGLTVFIVTIARLIWKHKDSKVADLTKTPKIQRLMSKSIRHLSITVLLLIPISGLTYIISSGLAAQLIFAESINWPSPGDYATATAHWVLAILLVALLILHIAEAVYHQFFIKDAIFERIWFKK
ncbi:MAG: cytochrome b/b6 domain-containing protein [Rhizobiales bacterium]|nr:cytochrome b/b6 domain-containing protein [Hyphomicrobiales bacterium]NRB13022.1 cytochrome b/b6 domain-containing protein [Hyphomicrobiales bacterium]